jgi:glyoxylase-like metal-dependent hydrolase (beta-lactamase superfamily II)
MTRSSSSIRFSLRTAASIRTARRCGCSSRREHTIAARPRCGASVWTPPHAVWRKIPNPATTDELPAGIEALELDGEPQQVVFFIQEHATLVTGDVLTGRDGVMHVFVDEADREPLLASLERIAELPIERVIVPHCETPIFVDGAARIRAAVAEARQS